MTKTFMFELTEVARFDDGKHNWRVRIVDRFLDPDDNTNWYEVECLDISDNVRTKYHRDVPEYRLAKDV